MTLHKSSISRITGIDTLDTWEKLKESIREKMSESGTLTTDIETEQIREVSLQYLDAVNIFMKLSSGVSCMANPYMRAAILENIGIVLNEIGALASAVFRSEDEVVTASSDMIVNNIILPTVKMKDALVGLKAFKGIDSASLDGAILSLNTMMNLLNAKTLGVLDSKDYSIVSGDDTVH